MRIAEEPRPAPAAARQVGGDLVMSGHWFGPPDRPLMGWLSTSEVAESQSGIVLLPPVGYQYWSTHRTLRVIAERLAGLGHVALRIDYDGCGDSAGSDWDPERLAGWRQSIREAVDCLRSMGCTRLNLFGARLGGTLALLEAPRLDVDSVVAWAPVVSGRRYAKELQLLSMPVPDRDAVATAGVVFTADTLSDLRQLDIKAIANPPARRVTLIDDTPAGERAASHLREIGTDVSMERIDGRSALEQPTEYASVPADLCDAVLRAVGEPPADRRQANFVPQHSCSLQTGSERIEERVVELGADRLVGVLAAPSTRTDAEQPAVVFLNTGSEPHVGPGRAWVEFARALTALGYPTLRVDFSGWGESPDLGHAPGRPYDQHCIDETVEIVEAVRERGYRRVLLVGLCASAWIALRAVVREPRPPIAGVVALNPQLYWQVGDPVEATMAETRARRSDEREREERGARSGKWSVLDRLGIRNGPGRWLDRLGAAGIPVSMVFAAGDDGVEYLRNRLSRRLKATLDGEVVTLEEVPEIDHSMHRVWLREAIVGAILRQAKRIGGDPS